MPKSTKATVYSQIISRIFFSLYSPGAEQIPFDRELIPKIAQELGLERPKNVGDVLYSFRFRAEMPEDIQRTAPEGKVWIIRSAGRSLYVFALAPDMPISPNPMLAEVKVPNATPGLVALYSFGDEQALLTRVRYNRLIDIFTGITCYSLQNHLRTTVGGKQLETDEVYIGIDRQGRHYVLPVQAKGGTDKLGIVQIEQDIEMCAAKFPNLICKPIAAQFMADDLIALFEFTADDSGVAIAAEKHYRLVEPDAIQPSDLEEYRRALGQN
jgi:hypothetical protein